MNQFLWDLCEEGYYKHWAFDSNDKKFLTGHEIHYDQETRLYSVFSKMSDSSPKKLLPIEPTGNLEELKILFQEYYFLYDKLTGVFNYKSIVKFLENEVHKTHNNNHNLAVIIVNIDKFIFVNHYFGHEIGDIVISTISSSIQNSLSLNNIFGRIGNEFLIIMQDSDLNDANILKEKIKTSVKLLFNSTITISIGVASLQEIEIKDTKVLLKQAEESLFEDKIGFSLKEWELKTETEKMKLGHERIEKYREKYLQLKIEFENGIL